MITTKEARHLLLRTGFSAEADATSQLETKTKAQAVDSQLNQANRLLTIPDHFTQAPPSPQQRKQQGKTFQRQRRHLGLEIKTWWYRQALTSPAPLQEQMVQFWHNHFTSSLRKVGWPPLLFQQHLTIRAHATGSFADLLSAMLQDPALLRYLDNHRNRRGSPNENLARELLELFTLGEGRYTEQDIKELARTLTGAGLTREGQYRFRPRWHDEGEKTIFGQRGRFGPGQIPALLLQQPACAEHLCNKLWRYFVSSQPEPAAIGQLAQTLRDNDYQLKPLLRTLLLGDAFWNQDNVGSLVRSPLDLLVGLGQALQLPAMESQELLRYTRLLGQDLFDPPNVKGWPTGNDWINSATLASRQEMMEQFATLAYERSLYAAGSQPPDPRQLLALSPVTVELAGFQPQQESHWQALLLDPVLQLK